MAPADPQGSLLNRSPRSRKSLAVASGPVLPSAAPTKRKRAHSIAPGENLELDDARRRSIMRPTKGILKPSNQADDATQDLSRAYQTLPQTLSPDKTNTTLAGLSIGEFRTNLHDNPSRKSLGGRRVSFAAHAHVRVFDSVDQNTNGTSSPASSPVSSSSHSAPSDPATPSPPPPELPSPASREVNLDPQAPQLQSPSPRANLVRRRRSSVLGPGNDDGEGEESMDVSDDEIPPPAHAAPIFNTSSSLPQSSNAEVYSPIERIPDQPAAAQEPGDSEDGSDYDDDGDMSMTGDFGPGIVARRRTMSMAGRSRRKSRMRSSIAVPPTDNGEEPMEFTVALDRPPPPESDALKALRAIANGNRLEDSAIDDDEEIDMDVTTAVTRLMAVRNSIGGQATGHPIQDDSFSSTEDSFDGMDAGDRTMNVTNLMGSFRASECEMDEEDVTMSATSLVAAPISVHPEPAPSVHAPLVFQPARSTPVPSSLVSDQLAIPTTPSSSNARGRPSPSKPTGSRPASPTKQSIQQFTAAFAPPHQTLKRPPPSSSSTQSGLVSAPSSPNKRRAVAANELSAQRVSVPAPPTPTKIPSSTSPQKGLPSKARRPSGYYRKSFGGVGAPSKNEVIATKPVSVSNAGLQRRKSIISTTNFTSTKKPVATAASDASDAKPHPSATDTAKPNNGSSYSLERKQPVALPSPTRGSPSVGSPRPVVAPRNMEKYALEQSNPSGAVDNDDPENIGDKVQDAPLTDPTGLSQGIDLGQWASNVQNDNVPRDDELDPISVDKFFMMTGIRFMDDLTCPRRSTIHPSQLQRRESDSAENETYPLSEYAVAMAVDVAQLETMSWIANDIRSAIEKYKAQYLQTEIDATKDIPLLFREFATAPGESREELLYVLKLIKANTILSAKASWYEWKRGWVQGLQTNAERTLDNLDADERQLEDITARAVEALPSLRTEYEEIVRELEEEQAAVAEIENCDQKFLSELKATIAEQRQELEVYRNDIADNTTKVARLDETLEDLEYQAREAKAAIATAQRQMDMQKSSTRAEVFRLRDELRSLQDLHLWRATELSPEKVEFTYDSRYRVVIPCRLFSPLPDAFEVLPLGDNSLANDDFPLVTEMMYRMARRRVTQDHDNKLTLRMIVQRLTDFWASYAQLRWQLSFIIIKYPLSLQLTPIGSTLDDAQGFQIIATLLLFQKTSKALITFRFDNEMLGNWPMMIASLKYDVAVVYGKADSNVIGEAVGKRLSEVNPAGNHACLVDACMEVTSRYP